MTFKNKREYRDNLIERAAPELANFLPFNTRDVAPRLWALAKEDFADGVEFAEDVLDDIGREGARKTLADEKRHRARGVLIVKPNGHEGRRRDNQGYRATERVNPENGETYSQQSLWWEMDYDEFAALFSTVMRILARDAETAAAFEQVMKAYQAHRDAPTVAEACRRAGIDPQMIEISDDDIRRIRRA